MSTKKTEPTHEERKELQDIILSGELSIGDSIRKLRKQVRLTQPKFANLVGVYPRVLLDVENDNGNPTIETRNKMLNKFGYEIGVVRKRSPTPISQKPEN